MAFALLLPELELVVFVEEGDTAEVVPAVEVPTFKEVIGAITGNGALGVAFGVETTGAFVVVFDDDLLDDFDAIYYREI